MLAAWAELNVYYAAKEYGWLFYESMGESIERTVVRDVMLAA
jgi:hypothetical protein